MATTRLQCPRSHTYEVCNLATNHTVPVITLPAARYAITRSATPQENMIVAYHDSGDECYPEIDRQAEWVHKGREPFVQWRTKDERAQGLMGPLRITERVINGNLYRFIGSDGPRYITCIVQLLMPETRIPWRQVRYVKVRKLNRRMFTGPRRNFDEYVTTHGVTIRSWERVINGKTYKLHSACNGAGVAIMAYLNVGGVEIPIVNAAILKEEVGK